MNALARILASLVALATPLTATPEQILKRNPFKPPDLGVENPAGPVAPAAQPWHPVLKAVLVNGSRSMANVGGVILRVGETIDGNRLVEVQPRSAVFERNGKRTILNIEK